MPGTIEPQVIDNLKSSLLEKEKELLPDPRSIKEEWKETANKINANLWEYVEILDGNAIELYQRALQISFDQWKPQTREIINSITNLLIEKMDVAIHTIRETERALSKARSKKYKGKGFFGWVKRLYTPFVSILDRSLLTYLKKSQHQLKTKRRTFNTQYENYAQLQKRVSASIRKFEHFSSFQKLEPKNQEEYLNLYKHLKIWKLDEKSRTLPLSELTRHLRGRFSIEQMCELFREYTSICREKLFTFSRNLKKEPKEVLSDREYKSYKREIRSLGATIATYRDFFLRTHPNPYIRTRFGFSEWVVGPEPIQTRKLLDIVFEVEQLDDFIDELFGTLKKKEKVNLKEKKEEIEETLHEMAQPLTARHLLRARVDQLLEDLEELNELGSTKKEVVELSGETLSRAMSIDWRHQVLFEAPLFHTLYQIHRGIDIIPDGKTHRRRLNRFNAITTDCTLWVKEREGYRHTAEIHRYIQEVEKELQSFQEQVEQFEDELSVLESQLLDYRFTFGQFFHQIQKYESEGKWIRNKFLFVFQYLESIENLLEEKRLR